MACTEGVEQQEQQQQPNLQSPKKSTVKGKQKKKKKNKKISQQQKALLSDPSKQQRTTSRIDKVLKAKQQRIIRNKNAMKRIPKILKTKQRRIIQNKNAMKRIPKVLKKQKRKQQQAKADKKKKQRKLRSILKKKKKKKKCDESGENKVTFDDVVYIREYERILVEQQLFVHYVYACLALGWNYNHQANTKTSKVNFDLNYQQRSSLKLLSTPSQPSISPTMIPNIQEHKDDKEKEEPSKLFPRSTATERVQILTEYGFGLKEVIKNEMRLKKKLERQQEQQQQQQESLKEHQNATATKIVGDNMKRVLSSAYNTFVGR